MDGWKTILSFWGLAYFQVLLLLVSGSVHNSSFKYKPLLLQYPFVHPKIAIFVAMFSTCSCFFVTFCCPQNFLSDFCTPGSRAGPVPVAAKGCYSQEASPYHLVPISFEHMGAGQHAMSYPGFGAVDGWNLANHLRCINPTGISTASTGAGFLPSTVWFGCLTGSCKNENWLGGRGRRLPGFHFPLKNVVRNMWRTWLNIYMWSVKHT